VGSLHAIFGIWLVDRRCWLDASNEYNPLRPGHVTVMVQYRRLDIDIRNQQNWSYTGI
jgi:hypothetical protein